MSTNTKKRVLTFLMALGMIFTLVACGGGGKDPTGTYKLTKMNSGGEEIDMEALAALMGVETSMTLELKADKTFTMNMGFLGDDESVSGTWKMEGDALILSAAGDNLPVTYDGKSIVMDMEGEILTLEKQ